MSDPVKIIVGEGESAKVEIPGYGIIAGKEGPKGDPGADGKSAYQVAVDNGFIGTPVEWLASLVGPQGDAGESAYESAVKGGYTGTEAEFYAELAGISAAAETATDAAEAAETAQTAAEAAQTAAETAASHYPKIENGNWWVYSAATGAYVDTGISAEGTQGIDGVSPAVTFAEITGGHTMTVTDKTHPDGQSINILNGQNGTDGVSPAISITDIAGGHRLTITDAAHPQGVSMDIMDGTVGPRGPTGIEVSDTQPTDPDVDIWVEEQQQGDPVEVYTVPEIDTMREQMAGNLAYINTGETADKLYNPGEYLVWHGQLYKVGNAAIAQDVTLNPDQGGNITSMTMARAFQNLHLKYTTLFNGGITAQTNYTLSDSLANYDIVIAEISTQDNEYKAYFLLPILNKVYDVSWNATDSVDWYIICTIAFTNNTTLRVRKCSIKGFTQSNLQIHGICIV